MQVVYALEPFPKFHTQSLFLAGPTPRDKSVPSWRPQALKYLEEVGYDGVVYVPEPRDGRFTRDYDNQVEWETDGLNRADTIVFWVPRDLEKMPAFTTNVEWGAWVDSGKVVLGYPVSAPKMRYLHWQAKQFNIPVFDTLEATLARAVADLDGGAPRSDGETQVPLQIWNNRTFQGWYGAQVAAGNRLDNARVLWTFRVGPARKKLFAWAVQVDVHVTAENRNKKNEFVFGRTDIASVVAYHGKENPSILLVEEFRSPARNAYGTVVELPGGSVDEDAPVVAGAKELSEETGIDISSDRLRFVGKKQLAATLSAHESVTFAVELTDEEFEVAKAAVGQTHGVVEDGERTTLRLATYNDLLQGKYHVDWSTLGMIHKALCTDPLTQVQRWFAAAAEKWVGVDRDAELSDED